MFLKSISIDEFLQRISSQPQGNVWSLLVFPNSDCYKLVEELEEILSIFAECEIGIISAKNGSSTLIDQIENASEDYLVIWDFETWNHDNWRELDHMRSSLARQRGVVLVLSRQSVEMMFQYAPNIVSWLGSRVYTFENGSELLTDEERQARLSELQKWSGLSNNQVIELAEAHKLPPEAEYGEWLVLLGREDLIEREK